MRWHLKHEIHGDKPWDVQAEGMRRSAGRRRYGYFLQQGLGKTALNLNDFIDTDDTDLNVVLSPSSFVGDWPLAPAEWGLGFLKSGMYGHHEWPIDWDSGLYAISHETLRGSYNARRGLVDLLKKRRCFLTFDESTGIKNPSSLLAEFMMTEAVKDATHIRLLDGTPIVQNVEDYYAKLRCLGELNGVNRYAFRNRFAKMGGFMGKQVKGMRNEEELAAILDRCSFRALKKDWRKGMPEQIEVPVHLEMTSKQLAHYRTMTEDFYALIGDNVEVTADLVLTQRMKFQQISSCMLMKDGKAYWIEEPKDNPKLKAVYDLYNGEDGKAIIVYYFDPSGRMLIEDAQRKKLNPAWITGKMKPQEIVEQKAKFNNDPTSRVLIGQIDQTSRGHTLLGQKGKDRCYRIFYYENSLSYMHRSQMNDRNHRGDQDETCYLYDLICSPIDQINVDILTGKRSVADGMDALVAEIRRQHRRVSA